MSRAKAKADFILMQSLFFDNLVSEQSMDLGIATWLEKDHGISREVKDEILRELDQEIEDGLREPEVRH